MYSTEEKSFHSSLLQILREIRNELHESNKQYHESNKLTRENYRRFDDEIAQLNEVHDEEGNKLNGITHELRELNQSVEEK